ncbi:DUF4265 domain-containing protein [Flavitalea sp.]|nr:DUF4265 domain-containing protein [Flavitalea sp.]
MSEEIQNPVKILFSFYSNVLDEWTKETMWAEVIDNDKGIYKIDSIPFYASVASDDIIFAEYDENEQMLVYTDTIEYSGNSTIQVVLMNAATDINTIRDGFSELGCMSEKLNDRYFAMEVPSKLDYQPVKQRLIELQESEVLDYAESCLSSNHHY